MVEEGEEAARNDRVTGSAKGKLKRGRISHEMQRRERCGVSGGGGGKKRETRKYEDPMSTHAHLHMRNKRVTTVQLLMLRLL